MGLSQSGENPTFAAALFKRSVMQCCYSIAGITIACDIPYKMILQEESLPFFMQYPYGNPCDIIVEFHRVPSVKAPGVEGTWNVNQLYCKVGGIDKVYYYPTRDGMPYAVVSRESGRLLVDYAAESIPYMNYSHNLIDLISLEMLLLGYHGLITHSSFIRWRNSGIIFVAPSGTGKSTQADLWTKYEQAECLNGDRTGLRKVKNQWSAYGLPYAGSSGIYRNESAPLAAVVVLRQGKENVLLKMKASDAFRAIYPETLIHQWDAAFVKTAAEYITELVTDVPVYMLSCRPDREAVLVLRDELIKEGTLV